MILNQYVYVKISSNNSTYWKSKGYTFGPVGGRAGANGTHRIRVKIADLQSGSNVNVSCRCDKCGKKYVQRFCRNTNVCYGCRNRENMIGNTRGSATKGTTIPSMTGELHPRWNPNKTEFRKYASRVRWLSEQNYRKHIDEINPQRLPRTVCGVENGYQLDHKVSIKKAFDAGMTPEEAGHYTNLQIMQWKANRDKWM